MVSISAQREERNGITTEAFKDLGEQRVLSMLS
jgi:hypothetical protein